MFIFLLFDRMFELFDLNGDGKISISDLKKTAE